GPPHRAGHRADDDEGARRTETRPDPRLWPGPVQLEGLQGLHELRHRAGVLTTRLARSRSVPEQSPADRVRQVLSYHRRTKHHLHRYAESPGYLDWATQPDPFRTFDGAFS